MIQHISKYILVALLFVVVTLQGQTQTNIVKDGNYTVTGSETLTATQSITLKPNSWIKPGSTFSTILSADEYINISLDSNENYVFTRAYQREMSSSTSIDNNTDVIDNITYFDGLGRPKQQIGIKASPDIKDIVTHIAYDEYGRQAKQFLPFERQSGALGGYNAVDITTEINSYYQNKHSEDFTGISVANVNTYSESIFEDSPLSRVLEQGAPGKDWKADPNSDADHTIKFDWKTNTANEVFYFWVNFDQDNTEVPILVKDGYYDADALVVTTTKDENWQPNQQHTDDHTTKEYKDKLGRVILKRTYNNSVAHDTYYVYDDFGNLTYVIPPKVTLSATDGVSITELSELCYQYRYDYRNRLIEKKIPGKGWDYIVYNTLDQSVMTQDANQRSKSPNEWLFTKYDAFGRVSYTGVKKSNESRIAHQNSANTTTVYSSYETKQSSSSSLAGTAIYYSNNAVPRYFDEILTINYYDDYEIGDQVTFNPADGAGTWEGMTPIANVKGLPTVIRVKVLETNKWITTATYYDDKGRPWETHVKNEYLGTEDWELNQLDFAGKVLKTRAMHIKNGVTITTEDNFTYDHMGRLLTQNQTINNQAQEQIVSNTYDELGQLESKETGGGLQTVDYNYNIRGWLTGINNVEDIGNDLFSFKINYNQVEGLYDVPQLYNGNIAQTVWKTASDNTKRSYSYEFDALNRVARANSIKGSSLMSGDSYSIWGIAYDKNGNIGRIARSGNPTGTSTQKIDELYYTYSNNKLTKVREAVTSSYKNEGFKDGTNTNDDYNYDVNGNMILDQNKGITGITYNHLNLPTQISLSDNAGFRPRFLGSISYTYDALGNKLLKKVTKNDGSSSLTTYAGNFVYKKNLISTCAGCPQPETALEFFNHPEGYIEPQSNGSFAYIYQHKDHLDNIRLSYTDTDKDGKIDVLRNNTDVDGDGDLSMEIREEKNYYPYGLAHKGYNNTIQGRKHNYGYVGKEENDELGVEWLDFGARNYNASIGRWMNLDPLAEKMRRHSPYNYAFDNPIYFMDPDGMMPQGPGKPLVKALAKALKKAGRKGKQARLKALLNDHRVSKADKGWIKNEMRHIKNGNRKTIRMPGNSRRSKGKGKELAHERGREAAKGYGYEHANLQDRDLHKLQHKYDNYGRKNKERPVIENTKATKVSVGVLVSGGSITSANAESSSSDEDISVDENGDIRVNTGNETVDSLLEFSYGTLDVYENAGKKVFGDNEVGKFVDDGLNPFSLGVFDLFKSMFQSDD